SGDVEVAGRGYRARSAHIEEAAGPPVELSLFHRAPRAFGPFGESRLVVAGILIGLLLLLLGAAVVIVRSLQGQVGQLLGAARRLRHGDFSRRVTVTGDDPFALLGGEFNAMSEELASKVEEVERRRNELEETIRRVGDAFAAGLDREGIVDLAVRTAVEACSADAGRAVPIDVEKMRAAHVGPRDEDLEAALQAAERRAFEVRAEDAGDILDQLETGPRATAERRRATHVAVEGISALAAPLRARVGALRDFQYVGVVSIARRGGEFSASERDLFAYLAGQAAVSIENAHLHERVQLQAVTDELTGLANVRQFHQTLESEIERCRRFATDVGLIMLDIDDFKAINDTHGHQQGDLVLQEVAQVLRGLSRDVDSPARYGGEEMVVVLPQTDLAGSEAVAERMRAAIETLSIRRVDGEGSVSVTASFGVAALPECAHDDSSLVAAADAALYRAKRAGKNRVERADALTAAG
ncbi:MAG: diguanylate cyclase, partial [Actinomycetota bacterium]|nr:diguanylate cyclase [Actinomycetota bacterium]